MYRKQKAKGQKTSKGYKAKGSSGFCGYTDRNLVPVNPLDQQFEPTDAYPVRQQKRMAGVS